MVNHVWMTGDRTRCAGVREDRTFHLQILEGGFFSFHGGGEGWVAPFVLQRDWGTLTVASNLDMTVVVDLEEEDRAVFFDGTAVRSFQPAEIIRTGDKVQ